MNTFVPGETVNVSYTGYTITGSVVGIEERTGWILVRQVYDTRPGMGYQEYKSKDQPIIPCAPEYVYRSGDERPPGPFEEGWIEYHVEGHRG